jgi:hypothetical protein
MTLPYDVARCLGILGPCKHPAQTLAERMLEQCKDCKRYTAPWGPRQPYIAPPDFVGDCPERIAGWPIRAFRGRDRMASGC